MVEAVVKTAVCVAQDLPDPPALVAAVEEEVVEPDETRGVRVRIAALAAAMAALE